MKESSQYKIIFYGQSDVGQKREHNEDNYEAYSPEDEDIYESKGHLFAVADGMGGHLAGEVASAMALEVLWERYYTSPAREPMEMLQQAVETANTKIYEQTREVSSTEMKMGTTLTALVIRGKELYIAHVGDSRAYRLRGNILEQLTQDHTWVAEEIRKGELTPEEAANHPHKSALIRSIGQQKAVEIETHTQRIGTGDVFLLCSDGLTNEVSEDLIENILSQLPPQKACEKLIEYANQHGGSDNITAVVISSGRQYPSNTRKWGSITAGIIVIILTIIAIIWLKNN